jgi:5-methylcytosine-specific restriction endonuclease McrA
MMWSPVWAQQGEVDLQATVDHILPKSKGGTDKDSNLRVICYRCNQEKGSDWPQRKRGRRRPLPCRGTIAGNLEPIRKRASSLEDE